MPTARRRRNQNKKKRDISQINNATNENNDDVKQEFNDGIAMIEDLGCECK